jgi:glyoxylase-like metal-dependent hydrolase (beta-lactamase superfamily II)
MTAPWTASWTEVADRVLVLRHPGLDVTSTLVIGQSAALVCDTLSSERQAAALKAAAERVTSAPLLVLNTHHHFDHTFGNAAVATSADTVWGHVRCAEILREHASRIAHEAAVEFPALAAEIAGTEILPPGREIHDAADLDLGGRTVQLRYFGRAHTDNDVVALVPDAGVTVAGDLVEVGAPPAFGDAWPLEWAPTLGSVLAAAEGTGCGTVFVPGHGDPVGAGFVRTQHAELAELEWLCREGHADGAPPAEVAARSPFGPGPSLVAVRRAYADLDGHL